MRNVDQISITNLITQHFILNFAKISVFQAETSVYVKSYQSEKLLKVVINNTLTIRLQRSLTCQNSYSDTSWYSWRTWLIAKHCFQKNFPFLSASTHTHFIKHFSYPTEITRNHFGGCFWKITKTFEWCFWDVSEMTQNSRLSRDVFETS